MSLEFYPLDCKWLENAGRSISRTSRHWTRSIHSSRTPWKPCVSRRGDRPVVCRIRLTGSGPLYPWSWPRGCREKDLLSRVRDTVLKLRKLLFLFTLRRSKTFASRNLILPGGAGRGGPARRVAENFRWDQGSIICWLGIGGMPSASSSENRECEREFDLDEIDDAELHQSLDSAERLCIALLESSG